MLCSGSKYSHLIQWILVKLINLCMPPPSSHTAGGGQSYALTARWQTTTERVGSPAPLSLWQPLSLSHYGGPASLSLTMTVRPLSLWWSSPSCCHTNFYIRVTIFYSHEGRIDLQLNTESIGPHLATSCCRGNIHSAAATTVTNILCSSG